MATRHSAARRLFVLCLAAALLVTATGSPAATEGSGSARDRPWSGFRIDTNDRASGSWLGARKVGATPGRVVYRIDPLAHPRANGFDKPRRMRSVAGPGAKRAAGPRATARAAWILSKYGSLRYEIQAAAVDAAVLHLLAGREYALNGRATKARLRQTGEASRIKRFAAIMLRDSVRRSGPYRIAVRQLGETAIGDPVHLGAQVVVSRSGEPLTSVPISLRLGRGPWRPAGETDESGRITVAYLSQAAGPQRVTARVGRVPEHRLLLMQPRRADASRVAVAGRKHVLAALTTAIVKARPHARIVSAPMTSGNLTRGSFRLTAGYGETPASATVMVRGPFGSRAQATCERKLLRVRQVPVRGNGTYPLPRLQIRQAGYYIWYVASPGNTFNLDATACGGIFHVRPKD